MDGTTARPGCRSSSTASGLIIVAAYASFWAAFCGAPLRHRGWGRRRGRAPGTPETSRCPSETYGHVLWTPRDNRGGKSSAPTAMHAVQAAVGQSGRPPEIRESDRRPGHPLWGATLVVSGRPKNCKDACPLRGTRRFSAQGELLLHLYDGPESFGLRILRRAWPGGASGDCTSDRARRHSTALRSSPAPCRGPLSGIECGRWRGRPAGPGPICWRRRAAPLRFAAGRLKP